MEKETKQEWHKPGIKSTRIGCLCCGSTDEILPLSTTLYYGSVGGWTISREGKQFYQGTDDWEGSKTLFDVEAIIPDNDNEIEYRAELYTPLRGGTYQRHSRNHWVLIEENEGYA